MNNYLIVYSVYAKNEYLLKKGTMKVKNKTSSIEAQGEFEKFLKKKYQNFDKLVVHNCTKENPFNNIFGDIFGNDNIF
jgi:hypothetical protein